MKSRVVPTGHDDILKSNQQVPSSIPFNGCLALAVGMDSWNGIIVGTVLELICRLE